MKHESEAASNPDQTSGEQWIREAPKSLKQARLGLNLFFYGSGLVCIAAFGVLYFEFSTKMLSLVMNALPVMGLTGNLMIFAGTILCLSVPTEVNSRGLLIGAAVGFFAKIIFSGTVFCGPGFLGLPLALCLKLAGYIGLILFALFLRKLLLYINRPNQLVKVYGLLVTTVLFLLGSWCMELMMDLGLIKITLIHIYSVMLVGLFLYPCFVYRLKKTLAP